MSPGKDWIFDTNVNSHSFLHLKNSVPADTISNLVKELLTTLDQLCLSSTLGEYSTRLDMIQTFHAHLLAASADVPSSRQPRFRAVINVLWNVHHYYSQYEAEVAATIKRLRKPIVKELDGYVSIASWKDVNVYALKESATRTHHHLHKFVKKYRLILDTSVK
ncbi:hypothetical protein BDK51DRAFT_16121, partial [Blyttiomyces helicus]